VLSTWATVTVALGGAFITGVATALVAIFGSKATEKIARMQVEHARRETWDSASLKRVMLDHVPRLRLEPPGHAQALEAAG
jgi:hypothetical protein